jgi:hypothetical protein
MKMKTGILLIVFISILLITYSKVEMKIEEDAYVAKKALIMLEGNIVDTAYQHTIYIDGGARINEWDRVPNCAFRKAYATGTVNPEVLGTYFIDYDGEDAAGNSLTTITRTVHVVENNVAFLNGIYNVTCTCKTVGDTVVTLNNYIAVVSSGSINNSFSLDKLEIGTDFRKPRSLYLKGSTIELLHKSCDFDLAGTLYGKLAASKNSFTLESTAPEFDLNGKYIAKYQCVNVFKNSAGVTN